MQSIWTRDHMIWTVGFIAAVATFLVSTTTSVVPDRYVDTVRDIAALAGFIAGYLGWSPLPKSDKVYPT